MSREAPEPGSEQPEEEPLPAADPTEEGGGPPAEHLREFLRERFGDVPPESPTEPDAPAPVREEDEDEEATQEEPP